MPTYFEFEVSLLDIEPRIWRRFLIPTSVSFEALHKAIQVSFGWKDCHLYEFRHATRRAETIAALSTEGHMGKRLPSVKKVTLDSYFTAGRAARRCHYLYDFGDDWYHDVKCVAVRTEEEDFKRRLLSGERAGPPEDCGGLPGYERLVEFLETGEDPYGDDPNDLADWLGRWRPDVFDLTKTKKKFDR